MEKLIKLIFFIGGMMLFSALPLNWFFRYEPTSYWLNWAGYIPSVGVFICTCTGFLFHFKYSKKSIPIAKDVQPTDDPKKVFVGFLNVLFGVLTGGGLIYYGSTNLFAKVVSWTKSDCSDWIILCRRGFIKHVIEQHEQGIVFSNGILTIGFGGVVLYFCLRSFWRSES